MTQNDLPALPAPPTRTDDQPVWEFCAIPVSDLSVPSTLTPGWEPLQLITDDPEGEPLLLIRRKTSG